MMAWPPTATILRTQAIDNISTGSGLQTNAPIDGAVSQVYHCSSIISKHCKSLSYSMLIRLYGITAVGGSKFLAGLAN